MLFELEENLRRVTERQRDKKAKNLLGIRDKNNAINLVKMSRISQTCLG